MRLVEVSPRDGLQNEGIHLSTARKRELIERAVAAGAGRLEVASFVDPRRVPQMADAEELLASLPRGRASYIGLVLNLRGLERALAAGVDEVNYVIAATDGFGERNQGTAVADGLSVWESVAARARAADVRATVTIAVAFGCPFEGELDPDRVVGLAAAAAAIGGDELAVADTIGVGVPAQVRRLVEGIRERGVTMPLRCHFHNTRNTGYANAVAALELGVEALDASIGGIGGCPFAPNSTGNVASEDLAYLFDRMGAPLGVDAAALCETARWLGEQLRVRPPGLLRHASPFPPTEVPT